VPDPTLRIIDWNEHYETAETRKLVRLRWVPLPNQIGRGYAKLMARHGFAGLGVWAALLEIASRKHRDQRNGTLDHTEEDIALESQGNLRELRKILPTLVQIGWVQVLTPSAGTPGESAGVAGGSADEGKGREGKAEKGTGGNGTGAKPRAHGPQEQLARDLSKALGSSLNPCRKQVAALVAGHWTVETLRPQLSKCIPGMAPWDWTKAVNGTSREGLTPEQLMEASRRLREQGR